MEDDQLLDYEEEEANEPKENETAANGDAKKIKVIYI